jgi:putative FmdB family regulatory protein
VPTYEYECSACRRIFEIRQRISAPALETCDACGGAVRRLLSPAPFILKGGGWHVTDYPSESRKKALASEKSTAGGDTSDKAGKDTADKDKAGKDKPDKDKAGKKDAGATQATTSAPAPASSSPAASD